eukprot:13210197-Ditylum_brightwellii.AAC.1
MSLCFGPTPDLNGSGDCISADLDNFLQCLATLCRQEPSYPTEGGWQAFKRVAKYATGAYGSAGNPLKCWLKKNSPHCTAKMPRARATHTLDNLQGCELYTSNGANCVQAPPPGPHI